MIGKGRECQSLVLVLPHPPARLQSKIINDNAEPASHEACVTNHCATCSKPHNRLEPRPFIAVQKQMYPLSTSLRGTPLDGP